MKESETTNVLLLLILLVLLVGFGFIAPILWVLGGVLGFWLLLKILGTIASGIGSAIDAIEKLFGQIFFPVWVLVSTLFRNNIIQWSLIIIAACISAWFYFITREVVYQVALMFLSLFAVFKAINLWDTITIRRKYKRDGQKDHTKR